MMRAAERISVQGSGACRTLLINLDLAMARTDSVGQCSAVMLVHDGRRTFGASVGDAWAIAMPASGGPADVLTVTQSTRALAGSGNAAPLVFHSTSAGRSIVLATDGASPTQAAALSSELWVSGDAGALARAVVAAAGGNAAAYYDDVAVIAITGSPDAPTDQPPSGGACR